jgi:hypothetical protein
MYLLCQLGAGDGKDMIGACIGTKWYLPHTFIKFEVIPSRKVGQYGSAICKPLCSDFFKRNCYVNQVLIIHKNI